LAPRACAPNSFCRMPTKPGTPARKRQTANAAARKLEQRWADKTGNGRYLPAKARQALTSAIKRAKKEERRAQAAETRSKAEQKAAREHQSQSFSQAARGDRLEKEKKELQKQHRAKLRTPIRATGRSYAVRGVKCKFSASDWQGHPCEYVCLHISTHVVFPVLSF